MKNKNSQKKSKAQKQAFRTYLHSVAQQQGYTTTEERGALGATNLIVGSPDTAKVVYTAHYDTCAALPFPNFITPKNFLLYLLYQLLITVFLMNGFQMKGTVTGFDDFTVILETDSKQQMIYKHAISTLIPAKAVSVTEGDKP